MDDMFYRKHRKVFPHSGKWNRFVMRLSEPQIFHSTFNLILTENIYFVKKRKRKIIFFLLTTILYKIRLLHM